MSFSIPTVATSTEFQSTYYNVYKISFKVAENGQHHVDIALISEQQRPQAKGLLYHVTGDAGVGMSLDIRREYDFTQPKVVSKEFKFSFDKLKWSQWVEIVEKVEPPLDPRIILKETESLKELLKTRDPTIFERWKIGHGLVPPARDCESWVDEVLQEAV